MKSLVCLFLALAGLLTICQSFSISCPSAEDLTPCTCKRLAYGLHVACVNFDKSSEFLRALKILQGYRVENVLVHGLNLVNVLPKDLFQGLEISGLRVEKSKLKFSQPAFAGLDQSLRTLSVAQQSLIESPEKFSLARLNKLEELTVKSSSLRKVSNTWLNGKVPNVRAIVLDENEINEIESYAFQNLAELNSISMADNRINTISRSMFPRPALALTKIDFCGNEIRSIPFDLFFDMPNLKEVLLSGNDLMTLEERTWKPVWDQLNSVLLHENNLVCDERLNWMKNARWPFRVDGSCVSPRSMAGKSLEEVYNL